MSKPKENWELRAQNKIHSNIYYTEEELKQIKKEFLKYCRENNISISKWHTVFNKFKGHNVKFIKQRIKRLLKENKPNVTKYKMFLLYGNIDGRKYWDGYIERQRYTNSKEYKDMTDEEFREYNLSRAVTKENMIKRHGKEKGLKKWNDYIEKQKYTKSLQRYINEFGEKRGLEIYKNITKRKIVNQPRFENFFSKVSFSFFKQIEERLKTKCFYGKEEKLVEKDGSFIMLDFYCPDYNIVIEFDGDLFHGNPELFRDNEKPNYFNSLTAKELRERDEERNNFILKQGTRLFRVWENTYRKNPDETIKNIIKNIKNKDINFYQI